MRALVVTVATDQADLASDALWALGVAAIEERSTADGRVELWTSLGEAQADPTAPGYGERLAADLGRWPGEWRWRFELVDDSVADTWRAFARPIAVADGLVVRPVWVPYEAPPGTTVVHIDPGATFGMGDHPTTVLCLRAVNRLVSPGDAVLDVGCGSGVLAIAACRLGAARAVAIDIAPAAVPAVTANAAVNGVADRIEVTTTPVAEVQGAFDLVLANILAPTLVEMAADLRRLLAPGGTLVISGVLADRHHHVLDALAPLRVESTATLAGWAAVTLR